MNSSEQKAVDPTVEPQSLYYSTGGKYQCSQDGLCSFCECDAREKTIIIASERLTSNKEDWFRVAPNHVLMVGKDFTVNVELMDVARIGTRVNGQSPMTPQRASVLAN